MWNSVDAPRKNYSVWRAYHCYLGFILDPDENFLVPFCFNLVLFSWTAPDKTPVYDPGTCRRGTLERPYALR